MLNCRWLGSHLFGALPAPFDEGVNAVVNVATGEGSTTWFFGSTGYTRGVFRLGLGLGMINGKPTVPEFDGASWLEYDVSNGKVVRTPEEVAT